MSLFLLNSQSPIMSLSQALSFHLHGHSHGHSSHHHQIQSPFIETGSSHSSDSQHTHLVILLFIIIISVIFCHFSYFCSYYFSAHTQVYSFIHPLHHLISSPSCPFFSRTFLHIPLHIFYSSIISSIPSHPDKHQSHRGLPLTLQQLQTLIL